MNFYHVHIKKIKIKLLKCICILFICKLYVLGIAVESSALDVVEEQPKKKFKSS
jgi:hypothetical protein